VTVAEFGNDEIFTGFKLRMVGEQFYGLACTAVTSKRMLYKLKVNKSFKDSEVAADMAALNI